MEIGVRGGGGGAGGRAGWVKVPVLRAFVRALAKSGAVVAIGVTELAVIGTAETQLANSARPATPERNFFTALSP